MSEADADVSVNSLRQDINALRNLYQQQNEEITELNVSPSRSRRQRFVSMTQSA